ncbi:MAG: TonB C-terminal domain-containing protein [Desulfuromonadaceae bacterium]|nr:TonB C-terminal domain-containing protein [Desulfuromonadaceae bacterium]
MADNHFQRRGADFHSDPKIGRIVLLSLILHLVLVLVFSGSFSHHNSPPKRPVYYVDLTQLPVANPRAGRPDGQSGAPKAVKKSTPAPIKKRPPTVKRAAPPTPAKKTIQPSRPTTKTVKKTTAKAVSKTQPAAKTAATSSQASANNDTNYQTAMSAVDRMRRNQKRAALKEKLAALASSDSRTGTVAGGGSNAPLGMPDGTGDQAGVSQERWLQARLTKNWSLSKYQVVRRDLECRVRITYNSAGVLTGKEFIKTSGDSTFDDSVTRAILKSRQLEFNPGRQLQVTVTFNLKDLMD